MSRKKQPDGAAIGVAISAKLGFLAGRLVATASSTYARLGVGSLEARVLELIGEGSGVRGADISKALGIDPAAVSRTLRTLVERGAIARSTPTGNRMILTARGEALCCSVRVLSQERGRRLTAGLSPADQARLAQFLERLGANAVELAAISPSFAGLQD